MSMLLKLAWRNMLRNKRRTAIAGLAVGIGLGSMIFSAALFVGMERNMVRSATSSFMGQAQIHRAGFRESSDVDETINAIDTVTAELDRSPLVDRYSERALTFAMVSSPANMSGASLVGVDPDKERYLSQIDDAIIEGAYFDGSRPREIVIGNKLADVLEVGIGDRVVVTATQAHTGDLSQEMFRVSGIYRFNINELDGAFAFIRLPKAREMLNLGANGAHEIAITFKSNDTPQDDSLPFWSRMSRFGNEALPWPKLMPQLHTVFEMADFNMLIGGLLLFGIVAFGIINTLFMSLYERLFEFGVLRAVGTRASGVRRLIVYEAGALAILSCAIGIILGSILIFIITKTGIDYRGIEITGTTINEMIYPVFHIQQFIIYPIAVFIFTILIGHYPALVAGRMSITEGMRKSL